MTNIKLFKALLGTGLDFGIVNDVNFIDYVKDLNKNYKLPSESEMNGLLSVAAIEEIKSSATNVMFVFAKIEFHNDQKLLRALGALLGEKDNLVYVNAMRVRGTEDHVFWKLGTFFRECVQRAFENYNVRVKYVIYDAPRLYDYHDLVEFIVEDEIIQISYFLYCSFSYIIHVMQHEHGRANVNGVEDVNALNEYYEKVEEIQKECLTHRMFEATERVASFLSVQDTTILPDLLEIVLKHIGPVALASSYFDYKSKCNSFNFLCDPEDITENVHNFLMKAVPKTDGFEVISQYIDSDKNFKRLEANANN